MIDRTIYLQPDRFLVFFPGPVAAATGKLFGLRFDIVQLFFVGQRIASDPFLLLFDAIPFPFTFETFGALISFVAARSGMPLGLGHFFDMEKDGGMCLACRSDACFKSLAHPGIIPGLDLIYIDAVGALFFMKAFQCLGNRPLCRLVLAGHRNAITIVPNENSQGYL